ncbi:hypothetical protein [Aquimarina macrocephali]|uniref:hypothetical protein n=1 Tax=Aquimarina macrocephali TaxID=666563 RepID=UPI0004645CCB|nr:hypothetical protein [Aquimarina macrocephali]
MKTLITLSLLIAFNFSFGQQKAYTKYKKDKTSKEFKTLNTSGGDNNQEEFKTLEDSEKENGSIGENISFGLSLGFNGSTENIKTVQISPIDNTVILNKGQKTSFVLSTVVSIPISFKKNLTYRFTDKDGNQIGQIHKISDWSFIASVNLITLQGAQSGNVFNQKISGGLGVSYNFTEDFSIGLTYELISSRSPKDFLIQSSGKEIQENGETVTALDITNNEYFYDKYLGTVSFKFIYKLTK